MLRKVLYWSGWAFIAILPVIYGIQVYSSQDLPAVQPWKWLVAFGAVVLIFFTRDRDDVLKHHVI